MKINLAQIDRSRLKCKSRKEIRFDFIVFTNKTVDYNMDSTFGDRVVTNYFRKSDYVAVHRQTCGDDVNNGEPFEKLIARLIKPGIDYRGLSNSEDRELNRGRTIK